MRRLVLGLSLVSLGCARQPEPLVVTYWYLDFCHSCRDTREGLSALAASDGDFELRLIEHREPGAAEAIRAQGFKRHGLLVTRGDSVVLKQADHRVRLADVEALLSAATPGLRQRGP